MVAFRDATSDDIPAIVTLLEDDILGQGREGADLAVYQRAFKAMKDERRNALIVGEDDRGQIVATAQLTCISGLSLRAARRAQIESVRVAREVRGQGIGEALIAEVERRARAEGCTLMQLTSNASREDARRFYERLGYAPSHTGFKKPLT